MDLFVEDGTTISGFAFLCTRSELWAAILFLDYEAQVKGADEYEGVRWEQDEAEYRRARARVRELLGMDDGESELGPDSTG